MGNGKRLNQLYSYSYMVLLHTPYGVQLVGFTHRTAQADRGFILQIPHSFSHQGKSMYGVQDVGNANASAESYTKICCFKLKIWPTQHAVLCIRNLHGMIVPIDGNID
jgi:hypothetical protein